MKMVEFTRDMRPQRAGEKRVVPDDVADRLVAQGDAKPCSSVFDKKLQSDETQSQSGTKGSAKPSVGRTYKTRKRN